MTPPADLVLPAADADAIREICAWDGFRPATYPASDFPVDVVSVPTVREPDGLAMSSRNTYLTASDREVALCLSRALRAGADAAAEGPSAIRRAARAVLVAEPLALIDYLVLVHPTTLEDVPEWYRGEALLAVAGRVGTTRLIDNIPLRVGPGGGALEVFSDVHAEQPSAE